MCTQPVIHVVKLRIATTTRTDNLFKSELTRHRIDVIYRLDVIIVHFDEDLNVLWVHHRIF